jgi:hypothetical protein
MRWVTMSEHDLKRIEVLTDVLAGRRTVAAAATILAISERQTATAGVGKSSGCFAWLKNYRRICSPLGT